MIVDWQDKLHNAMPEHLRSQALKNAANLKWLFERLGYPVITTEQYPKGLGSTHKDLHPVKAIPKMSFSAIANEEAVAEFKRLQPQQILAGRNGNSHLYFTNMSRSLSGQHTCLVHHQCLLVSKQRRLKDALQKMVVDGARLITAEAAMFEILKQLSIPSSKSFHAGSDKIIRIHLKKL